MNCFVTGASGFIGANLVHELVARKHRVRALLRPGSDLRGLRDAEFERVEGDLSDVTRLKEAMRECDWCFHVAASYHLWLRDYRPMYAANVEGTRNVLELMRELKRDEREIEECPVPPENLVELLRLIEKGTISGKIAKTVFDEMYKTGKEPAQIVEEKGLVQVSDTGEIERIIVEIMAANAGQVEEFRGGKEKVFGFFVGQVMRASKGKANPAVVNELLLKKLNG